MVQVRVPKFEIKEDEWPVEADHFNRQKEIENLTPILLNAEAPLVFAMDAQWGKGKTTFIRLWQHYLKREEKIANFLSSIDRKIDAVSQQIEQMESFKKGLLQRW